MSSSSPTTRTRGGFAIIDLVVVLATGIIAVGLVSAAVGQSRESADLTATLNNLRQCAKAVHTAHDQFKKFPPYYGTYGDKKTSLSFHTHLLPYVDMAQLYSAQTLDPKAVVPAYLSPMDPTRTGNGEGTANFPLNLRLYFSKGGVGALLTGEHLIYPRIPHTFVDDGTANTLLFATKFQNCGKAGGSQWADINGALSPTAATFGFKMAMWQRAPTKERCNPLAGTAVSFTATSIQVAMCDASVRSVSATISQSTWRAVHTPNANDMVGSDWDK